VRAAQEKISALEKASRRNKDNDATYASAIKKLKGDLEIRNHEMAALAQQVETYKNQNENLISTVGLQKAEIDDKLNQIKSKQDEIGKLQDQVNQLMVKSAFDQGEAYFARAAAAEEIAKRLSVRLELIQVTGQSRIPTLNSGKIDLLLAALTHTRAREKAVDFSITYVQDGLGIMVKKGR